MRSMSEPVDIDVRPAPLNAFELFRTFARISLYGFGGVLAWTHRMLVEDKRWLSDAEFNELLALSQFLPGPNLVNFSVVFGSRLRGVTGAIAAFAGLTVPPVIMVIGMAFLYSRYGDIEALRRGLTGISAAAAGMIIGVVIKLSLPLFRGPLTFAPFVAIICFVTIGIMRWPLAEVLLVMVPASVGLAFMRRK